MAWMFHMDLGDTQRLSGMVERPAQVSGQRHRSYSSLSAGHGHSQSIDRQ